MDSGAGLVALERSDVTWLCRSGSAVLSQQFDKQVSWMSACFHVLLVPNADCDFKS